jgi:hypothetical protein
VTRERGAASLELALGIGLLMLPVAMLVFSFGPALQMRSFVRLSAAEASRAIVISDGDTATAFTQIATMASNEGFDPSQVRVGLCGAAPAPLSGGGSAACPSPLPRGVEVVARVEIDVPLIIVPGIGASVGGFPVWAEHGSLVDLYRSVE